MTVRPRILVVDDEAQVLSLICDFLSERDWHVDAYHSGDEALKALEKRNYNVIVTDLRMQPVDGLQLLRRAKEKNALCEIIMITAYATMDSSLEALRGKVFDYLEKPIRLERLDLSLQNALMKNQLARENADLVERLKRQNEDLEHKVEEATRDLQDRTIRDHLTGLYNYRCFVNVLTTEISRSVRYGRPLSLGMLDLDHFKDFNDTLGHLAGNEVLKKVAFIMRAVVRENDVVARYGGEEFAVILPETTKLEAVSMILRIQKALRDRHFAYRRPSTGEQAVLTISAGIADCPGNAEDYDGLVRMADAALYQAKNSGRDRLAVSSGRQDEKSFDEKS